MKQLLYYFLVGIFTSIFQNVLIAKNYDFQVTSTWVPIKKSFKMATEFGGQQVHIGDIIMRNKKPETPSLKRIVLKWNPYKYGATKPKQLLIENLAGSLYKLNHKKSLEPLEESVLCDSFWNKDKQCLVCEFEKERKLDPCTEFSIVLTVPKGLERKLKYGYFKVDHTSLPRQFRRTASRQKLSLARKIPR